MDRHLAVFGLTLATANTALHGTGLTLLHILHKSSLKGSQTTLITHLSLAEAFISIMQATTNIAKLCMKSDVDPWAILYDYATMVEYTGFAIVYYLLMIYITLYRCIKTFLGISYSQFWSDRKTSNLCVVTWILAAASCALIGILKYQFQIQYASIFYKFVYPPADIVFLILTSITYAAIFCKHRKSKVRFYCSTSSEYRQRHRHVKRGITTKFYIPTLLIATCILCMVVPDMIVLHYIIILGRHSKLFDIAVTIIYALAMTSDGVTYIFLQKEVRRLLLKKLHMRKNKSKNTASHTHIFFVSSQRKSKAAETSSQVMEDPQHVRTLEDSRPYHSAHEMTTDTVRYKNARKIAQAIIHSRALKGNKVCDRQEQARIPSTGKSVDGNTTGPFSHLNRGQHNIAITIDFACTVDSLAGAIQGHRNNSEQITHFEP